MTEDDPETLRLTIASLQRELALFLRQNEDLLRACSRMEARLFESEQRAHALERERDEWRARATA